MTANAGEPESENQAAETVAPTKRELAAEFESAQPSWQQTINSLCESWIFAILLAMILRQFFVEAYRIPSASMEPTLYGDTAFMKADHVMVDKFAFRFTGPERWGVTVFQYPIPEVTGRNGGIIGAIQSDGSRLDSFPMRPQLQRNVVKRLVGMPGDVFFVRHGDLYLQQADGSFAVSPKPAHIQEALWLPIYEHGVDESYVPWQGTASTVRAQDEGLLFSLRDEPGIRFTQPLYNVYVKPGLIGVRPMLGGNWEQVEVSLLKPTFRYKDREGSLYDLRNWQINRLTTADLDRKDYGSSLNDRMGELVGDVRLGFIPDVITGSVRWQLSHGSSNVLSLELTPESWRLSLDGQTIAGEKTSLKGRQVHLALVDNQATMEVDGVPVMAPLATTSVDPRSSATRTSIRLAGSGELACSALTLDRDVHYSVDGILSDERPLWTKRLNAGSSPAEFAQIEGIRHQRLTARALFIDALADLDVAQKMTQSMEMRDRGQREWLRPLGVSPETAFRIPEDAYLFLGDNSPFSSDSRRWGWVPGANLRGQVVSVVFPRMRFVD